MVTNLTARPMVLVIDDEESMREGCRQILEEEGYRTTVARDGKRGVQIAERMNPGVVLVDLRMPGMDGMAVLGKIRGIVPGAACIVITGYGTIDSAVEAMKVGACDYLCKPFDDARLLQAVESGFGRGSQKEGTPSEVEKPAQDCNRETILDILEKAACNPDFIVRLTEEGSKALDEYNLSWEEKAALISGDIRWIEDHVGKLNDRQKTWLNCRLQQEIW
ncbi:response regulator [Planctomycetota bacterium]